MKHIIRIFLATLVIVAIGGGGYFRFAYQSRAAGTSTASTGSYTQVVQVKSTTATDTQQMGGPGGGMDMGGGAPPAPPSGGGAPPSR